VCVCVVPRRRQHGRRVALRTVLHLVVELSFTTLLVVSLWRGPLGMGRGALTCVGGLVVRAVVLASSAVPSRDRDGLGWVPKSRSKPARLPHARLQVRTLPHQGSVASTTL